MFAHFYTICMSENVQKRNKTSTGKWSANSNINYDLSEIIQFDPKSE